MTHRTDRMVWNPRFAFARCTSSPPSPLAPHFCLVPASRGAFVLCHHLALFHTRNISLSLYLSLCPRLFYSFSLLLVRSVFVCETHTNPRRKIVQLNLTLDNSQSSFRNAFCTREIGLVLFGGFFLDGGFFGGLFFGGDGLM